MGIPQQSNGDESKAHAAPSSSTDSAQTTSQPTTTGSNSTSPQNVNELPPAALDLAAKLFDAARDGNASLLRQYLFAGIPPNLTNSSGDTLLMLASYYGHADAVKILADKGADVNSVNGKGQSPVAGAIFKGFPEVVKVLVEAGADLEAGQPNAVECVGMFRREECAKIMGVELPEGGGEGGVEGARDAVMRRLAVRYANRVEDE